MESSNCETGAKTVKSDKNLQWLNLKAWTGTNQISLQPMVVVGANLVRRSDPLMVTSG